MATQLERFQRTLRQLFMLDQADLDFGIYRIMNQKRNDIDRYLNMLLPRQVKAVLAENRAADTATKQKELDDMIASLRKMGVEPDTVPAVVQLKAEIAAAGTMEDLENTVYSHLTTFFARYYDSGDFVSLRRYKKDVYAIPYEGEEVKLHWANADQYYIKTGEYFRNYSFTISDGKRVEFTLREASTEQNNNRTSKNAERRFSIFEEEPITVDGNTLHINFTYELYPKKGNDQKTHTQKAFDTIKNIIPSEFQEVFALRPTDKDSSRTLLQKHLNDYVARNTFDYFIHKDLKGFLSRELDFYIKNEVLEIDDINARSTDEFLKHLSVIKALKSVGASLIQFLAQLEEFQKRLWLKKKFVVQADYCITLDRVPQSLYEEICANDRQREEWVRLFAIDEIKGDAMGLTAGYSVPLTTQFLSENQTLVLDTSLFSSDFKHKLLCSIQNLDDSINGTLINSENFQALSLLQTKFDGSVRSVYIDPPYNTNGDGFIYKDNYQESSWLSFIYDRLELSKRLYGEGGSVSVSIDIKELDKMIALLDMSIGDDYQKANITVRRASITGAKVINPGLVNISENVLMYANGVGKWIPQDAYRERDYDNRYGSIITNIQDNMDNWQFSTVLEEFAKLKNIPKSKLKVQLGDSYEEELLDFALKNANAIFQFASLDLDSVGQEAVELYHKSKKNPDKIFHIERGDSLNDYYIRNGKILLFYKDRLRSIGGHLVPVEKVSDIWDDVLPNDIHNEGGVVLKKGKKPEKLVDRIIEATSLPGELILDYFVGSGTSAAVALKSGRRFIGVEVNEYFDDITLRRIKNTLHGDTSGVTYKYQWKGGGIVKYLRLEQYEDTLNNLTFNPPTNEVSGEFFNGFLLGYMLDVETRDSLFNLKWFVNPFDMKLLITKGNKTTEENIDLPETFNYLIGLNISSMSWPMEGIQLIEGVTRKGKRTLVIWRDCNRVDNEALNDFFVESGLKNRSKDFDTIYINGDNLLANTLSENEASKVMLIEPEFNKQMFKN